MTNQNNLCVIHAVNDSVLPKGGRAFGKLGEETLESYPNFSIDGRFKGKTSIHFEKDFSYKGVICEGRLLEPWERFLDENMALITPFRRNQNGDLITELVYISRDDFSLYPHFVPTPRGAYVSNPRRDFENFKSPRYDSAWAHRIRNHYLLRIYTLGRSLGPVGWSGKILGIYDLNEEKNVKRLLSKELKSWAVEIMRLSAGRLTSLEYFKSREGKSETYVLDISRDLSERALEFREIALRKSCKSLTI